eukprot:c12850_g1_i2.p1 GENE.c12850_g1_i2~~c12850_g1_i2.p1  ORF type:complete len:288 (-),score=43.43 c12850_g1_i2:150-911(-)
MSDIDDEPFEMVIRNTQVLSHGRQVAGLDPAQARTQQAETPNVFGPFLDNTVLGKARPMDEVTYVGCCSCSRLIPNLDKFLPNYAVLLVLVMTIVSATYNWQKAAIFAGGCLMLHFGYALVLTSLGSKSLLRGSFFVVCVGAFISSAVFLAFFLENGSLPQFFRSVCWFRNSPLPSLGMGWCWGCCCFCFPPRPSCKAKNGPRTAAARVPTSTTSLNLIYFFVLWWFAPPVLLPHIVSSQVFSNCRLICMTFQ